MFDDLPDFFRNSLPYFLVLFLVCSPTLADSNFDIKRLVSDFRKLNFIFSQSVI